MPLDQEKASKFMNAIQNDARLRRQQILDEIEAFNRQQLDQAQKEVLEDARRLIQQETADMRNSIRHDVSVKEIESKRALLKKREALTREIFQKARQKLVDFTQTSGYEAYLTKACREIAALLPATGGKTLELRPEDSGFAQTLLALLPGAQVKTGAHIGIGGLRVIDSDGGRIFDQTLEARLQEQHTWFMENCTLSVSE